MKKKDPKGFTLIELLAAISVLLVLVTVMSQIVGLVSSGWRSGRARIDGFTQARTALGLMDRDFQRLVLRPELAAFTDASGTEGALAFYSRVQGGEGNRAVSLVEYRLEDPATAPRLVRCDYGLDYGESDPDRSPTYGDPDALPDLEKVQARDLAPGVLRMEWRFVDATGAEHETFQFDHANPTASTNTRVMRISLLVLDTQSYDLLSRTGHLSSLLTQTSGKPAEGETPGKLWERLISTSALSDEIPRPVLDSIRVFERSFTIPLSQ